MAGKNSLPNDIHISMKNALEDSSQKKKNKKIKNKIRREEDIGEK